MGERWLGLGIPWLSSLVTVTGEWKEPLGMVSKRLHISPAWTLPQLLLLLMVGEERSLYTACPG